MLLFGGVKRRLDITHAAGYRLYVYVHYPFTGL